MSTADVVATRVRTGVTLNRLARYAPRVFAAGAVVFALVWILFAAPACKEVCSGVQTNFGSAVHDPQDFLNTLLDGLTAAGLYFVVASGFTLIFGLMRVVNMAHGAFFLLAGYITLKLQREFTPGGDSVFGLTSDQVRFWQWVLPALVAAACIGILGIGMQQVFLRWNQGQDLRQAMITIAISIVLADQMVAHFGGTAEDIAWWKSVDRRVDLHVAGVHYTLTRLFILAVAVGIGLALWLWLKRTRIGMVIRAGVDDRQMVSALGVNIQLVFALAFVVGCVLAGFGGAMGGSFASLGPGVDSLWLLYSLVVVIIGGMGSLGGAAIGAILLGIVQNFSSSYLPANYSFYSIIFTFVLLAIVLAVRPLGLFGRPA